MFAGSRCDTGTVPLYHLLKEAKAERYHPFNLYGPPPTEARVAITDASTASRGRFLWDTAAQRRWFTRTVPVGHGKGFVVRFREAGVTRRCPFPVYYTALNQRHGPPWAAAPTANYKVFYLNATVLSPNPPGPMRSSAPTGFPATLPSFNIFCGALPRKKSLLPRKCPVRRLVTQRGSRKTAPEFRRIQEPFPARSPWH